MAGNPPAVRRLDRVYRDHGDVADRELPESVAADKVRRLAVRESAFYL
jgi:hypothetical protein